MVIYILLFFVCLLPEFVPKLDSNRTRVFVITFVGIILCFSYMNGSDWRGYEEMYNIIDLESPFENVNIEYGYYMYMLMYRYLTIDFWIFFIITKVIVYIITIKYILKYQKENVYFTLAFFIGFYGLSLFIDNPMRTLIAGTIILFSFRYIESGRLFNYILIISLASLFHMVSIVMIPIYWLVKKKFDSKSIILIYIVVNVVLWVFDQQFRSLLLLNTGNEYINSRLAFYFAENSTGSIYTENRIISLGLLVRFFLFALLIMSRSKIESNFGHVFFNIVVFDFYFHRLGISIPILGRPEFYVCLPFCIAIVNIANSFNFQSKRFYISFLLILTLYSAIKIITFDYKFIPYTNYLSFIFKEKPSFEERSNYNFYNSPYNK